MGGYGGYYGKRSADAYYGGYGHGGYGYGGYGYGKRSADADAYYGGYGLGGYGGYGYGGYGYGKRSADAEAYYGGYGYGGYGGYGYGKRAADTEAMAVMAMASNFPKEIKNHSPPKISIPDLNLFSILSNCYELIHLEIQYSVEELLKFE